MKLYKCTFIDHVDRLDMMTPCRDRYKPLVFNVIIMPKWSSIYKSTNCNLFIYGQFNRKCPIISYYGCLCCAKECPLTEAFITFPMYSTSFWITQRSLPRSRRHRLNLRVSDILRRHHPHRYVTIMIPYEIDGVEDMLKSNMSREAKQRPWAKEIKETEQLKGFHHIHNYYT